MAISILVGDAAAPSFPYKCAACLAPASEAHSVMVRLREPVYLEHGGSKMRAGHHDHQLEFDIPYCATHLQQSLHSMRRLRRARRVRAVLSLLASLGVAAAAAQFMYMYTNLLEQQTLAAAGILAAVLVVSLLVTAPLLLLPAAALAGVRAPSRKLFRPESHSTLAVGIVPPTEKTPEGGTIELRFANKRYAELFCQVNGLVKG